jgi:hypothetical protein
VFTFTLFPPLREVKILYKIFQSNISSSARTPHSVPPEHHKNPNYLYPHQHAVFNTLNHAKSHLIAFFSSQSNIMCTTSTARNAPAETTTKDAAADGTDTESVAMSISLSGSEPKSEARPQRWQCCRCELHEALNRSFAGDGVCWHCGHAACQDCASYKRVTEQPLGL